MSKIVWDAIGERSYEIGLDHGVIYFPYIDGVYIGGVPWNGLTNVSESENGHSASTLFHGTTYAGAEYSPDEFGGTIKAYTYPDELESFFGEEEAMPGVIITHQERKRFGLSYRTQKGNDTEGVGCGYKLHILYNVSITEFSRSYSTISSSNDIGEMEWHFDSIPVEVDGYEPIAEIVLDSTRLSPEIMASLEAILYGSEDTIPRLPSIEEIFLFFEEGGETPEPLYPEGAEYLHGCWLKPITITRNGTYVAKTDGVDGYLSVVVDVEGGSGEMREYVVVDSLPDEPDEGKIYLLVMEDTEYLDQYDEYIVVDGEYERVGPVRKPLTDAELDAMIGGNPDPSDVDWYVSSLNEISDAGIDAILNS